MQNFSTLDAPSGTAHGMGHPRPARVRGLRLNRNEPVACHDRVGSYPDPDALIAMLAVMIGVPSSQLVLTAGADHALDAVCRVSEGPAVMLCPDFIRYEVHAENAALPVVRVPIDIDNPIFPVDALLDAASAGAGVVIISSIANPTGCIPPDDIVERLRSVAPRTLVVIDEVYRGFAAHAFAGMASVTPGVLSIGSLSKTYGPGLRVGYIVGEHTTLSRVRRFVSPFSVGTPSIEHAIALLANPQLGADAVARQVAARRSLAAELRLRQFQAVREGANWVHVRAGSGAAQLAVELEHRGVAVAIHSSASLCEWLRVSTPSQPDVAAFVDVLDEILLSPVATVAGQFVVREVFRQPEAWVNAPFVMHDGVEVVHLDHVAITVGDDAEHLEFLSRATGAGGVIVEGPGVWPQDFCSDLDGFPRDLEMVFGTIQFPTGGLVVVAAPRRPGDQLSRFRHARGPWGVHHVALRTSDIERVSATREAAGWTPMSSGPTMSDGLAQLFLRNEDGQILELISRRAHGAATFSCANLASLRRTEER